jgi:bifunctional UDP-N-acetylglucosamine pyrophosphorylase/glucosamine-1-phosphate N-acetyltransferase
VVAVDASIGRDAIVGPFCYLRPGTVLDAGAKAGTFVEIKQSRIGARTKVPHLSYIGDADIGGTRTIAAANVTGNFPHDPDRPKGKTTIGKNVRTGVDNTFVAPVTGWRRCLGFRRERSSRTTSRPDHSRGSRRGRRRRKGWVYERGKRETWRRLSSPGCRGSGP